MSGIDQASRDQLVVVVHNREDLLVRDVIGFQLYRIDDDLEQVLALALHARFEDAGVRLKAFAKLLCNPVKAAFGRVAVDVDNKNRELRGIEFGYDRLARFRREEALGHVDLVFDVKHGLIDIHVDLELKHQLRGAFSRKRAEGLQAFQRLHFFFDRAHQQTLGVFRRYPGQWHGDRHEGDRYVRVRFLGQADISRSSRQHGTDEDGNHHPRPANGTINQACHGRAPPCATGRTFTPSFR